MNVSTTIFVLTSSISVLLKHILDVKVRAEAENCYVACPTGAVALANCRPCFLSSYKDLAEHDVVSSPLYLLSSASQSTSMFIITLYINMVYARFHNRNTMMTRQGA